MLKMNGKCVISGDFNRHLSKMQDGSEGLFGGFGFGKENVEGERILDVADSFGLKVVNTLFKKDGEKLISYKSGGSKTAIVFILVGKVRHVKAIPGEEVMI